MKKYFLIKDGEKRGPYSISELENIGIDNNTLIWLSGLDTWTKAGDIEELNSILETLPPPLPDAHNKPTIDVRITKKSRQRKYTKEEKEERLRRLVKKILCGIGVLISIFIVSVAIGFITYAILLKVNQPTLIPSENQKKFNDLYRAWKSKNEKWKIDYAKWNSEKVSKELEWENEFLMHYYSEYLESGIKNYFLWKSMKNNDASFSHKKDDYILKRTNDYCKRNPNFEWKGGPEPQFDIYWVEKYLGHSKYDLMNLDDCCYDDRDQIWTNVNEYRINNLKKESEDISMQVFYIILIVSYCILVLILIIKYLFRFVNWLTPSHKNTISS